MDGTVTFGNLLTMVTVIGGFIWAASRQTALLLGLRDEVSIIRSFMVESRADRQAIRERLIKLETEVRLEGKLGG
jgi:hypothetical protein